MRNSRLLLAAVGLLVAGTATAQQSGITTGTARKAGERVIDVPASTKMVPMRSFDGSETRKKGSSGIMAVKNDSLFQTVYDFQTNGSMPDRIINWPNPSGNNGIQATMMYMAALGESAARGTYGAIYFDAGSGSSVWTPINTSSFARIETERAGFNEIDHLNTFEVINVSHTGASGINVAIEVSPASGEFANIIIPGSIEGFWPRVAVDKTTNAIHVIWAFQDDVNSGRLAYSRSTDKGDTWTTPIFLSGSESDLVTSDGSPIDVQGGDAYQIAANNNNVVIWLFTSTVSIIQRRSTDGGETFPIDNARFISRPADKMRIYQPGTPDAPADSTMYVVDPQPGSDTSAIWQSDTSAGPGSGFDLMVDNDGVVRGVFPFVPTYLRGSDVGGTVQQFIYQGDFSYTDVALVHVRLAADDTQETSSFIPVPEGVDNSASFLDTRGFTAGFGRFAQLGMDASKNLYVTFVSGAPGDTVVGTPTDLPEGSFYFNHIYATYTTDGETWGEPLNLTANRNDAQAASLADLVDNELYIAYQSDYYPGDYLTSSGAGGSGLHPNVPSTIRAMIVPTADLPAPGPSGVRENVATASGNALVATMPNPSNGSTRITYKADGTGTVSIRLFNNMGEEVMTVIPAEKHIAGTHSVTFDASSLATGSYLVVLTGNGGRSVQSLNIVH